ncbi:hypothetical protein [Williamsia muralis]|uniref:hypothetical protein n=1 Tax=Williamsia marianensis TaxID=85044 RepID=UPI003810CCBA
MTTQTPTQTRSINIRTLAAALGAAVLFAISLWGPAWLFIPASPAPPIPAMALDFSGLDAAVHSGIAPTTGFQQSYFGWLAWTTAIICTILAFASSVVARKAIATATIIAGILGLVFLVFGTKGPLGWSAYIDQIPNLRAGSYLSIVALLLVVASGLASSSPQVTAKK